MRQHDLVVDAEAPTDLRFADQRRDAFFRSARFRRWIHGSWVTQDGTPSSRPIMVFRGCLAGERRDAAPRSEADRLFWLTSSRLNASFFEDGELQNAFVRLLRPLVIGEAEFRLSRSTPDRIAEDARRQVALGLANWDGVIFEDIVDGSHPSTVYAVFPREGSIAHAVMIVGRTTYAEDGMPRFSGLQPSDAPVGFGRFDRIGRNMPVPPEVDAAPRGSRRGGTRKTDPWPLRSMPGGKRSSPPLSGPV